MKISVCIITYNQEEYIRECIDGVIEQKSSYEYEIIIGEDCSTDNTLKICREYANKFPTIITLIERDVNLGMNKNWEETIKACKGEYIAICEGDDYWTDTLKLQKQVDFLDTHKDYNITVGQYKYYYEKSKTFKNSTELFDITKSLSLKNYIAYNFGHTATFLFRNNFSLPNWLNKVHALDQSVFILATGEGKIKYFEEYFSVYRINEGSISNHIKPQIARENGVYWLKQINKHTKGNYQLLINNRKLLNNLYYYFEKATNKYVKLSIKVVMYGLRWFGINVLVKFVK